MQEGDREERRSFSAKKTIENCRGVLEPFLRGIQIDTDGVPADLWLPPATMAEWQAIFQNVFINAVNAMLDTSGSRIVCIGGATRSRTFIHVMDNGAGVELSSSEELFEPFVRKLEISKERKGLGLGGVGMGLTIVRTIAEAIGCDTRFIAPEHPFTTAFELAWKNVEGGVK
jgi:C4-dicarboxylate-specific signal transduction histidine kinase